MFLLRSKLGLTLRQMAWLLGVSESLVSKYEHGQRGLPAGSITKITAINQFLQNTADKVTIKKTAVAKEQENMAAEAKKFLDEQAYNRVKLEYKINIAEKAYTQQLALNKFIEYIKQQPAHNAPEKNKKERGRLLMMQLLEQQASERAEKHGLHILFALQLRLLANNIPVADVKKLEKKCLAVAAQKTYYKM